MIITTKNGKEFERKPKQLIQDKKICIKISTDLHNRGMKKADELNITFSELIRQGMEYMISKEVKEDEKK